MMTTERFEKAWRSLYAAFHEGTLNAGDCAHCAVGNIVGSSSWARVLGCANGGNQFDRHQFVENIKLSRRICGGAESPFYKVGVDAIKKTGYSQYQLFNVEAIFMDQFFAERCNNKDAQFKGLCAVIEYLCELDGIPNPMDYSKFFETIKGKPKYELA